MCLIAISCSILLPLLQSSVAKECLCYGSLLVFSSASVMRLIYVNPESAKKADNKIYICKISKYILSKLYYINKSRLEGKDEAAGSHLHWI